MITVLLSTIAFFSVVTAVLAFSCLSAINSTRRELLDEIVDWNLINVHLHKAVSDVVVETAEERDWRGEYLSQALSDVAYAVTGDSQYKRPNIEDVSAVGVEQEQQQCPKQ